MFLCVLNNVMHIKGVGCGVWGVECGGAWKSSVGTNQILPFMRPKGKLVVATIMAAQ